MILSHLLPSTLFLFFSFQLPKLLPPFTPLLALLFLSRHHSFFASFFHIQHSCFIFPNSLKFCARSFCFHCSIDVGMFKLTTITTFKLLALFAFSAKLFSFCCFISCCLEVAWKIIIDFFFEILSSGVLEFYSFFFHYVNYHICFFKLLTFVLDFVFNVVTFMLGFVITFYNFGMFSTSNKLIQLSFHYYCFCCNPWICKLEFCSWWVVWWHFTLWMKFSIPLFIHIFVISILTLGMKTSRKHVSSFDKRFSFHAFQFKS